MKIKELIQSLIDEFPIAYQESYDNSGGQIVFNNEEITGVLLCLDVNNDIVTEAIEKKCNLIISHHPIFFKPIKKISDDYDGFIISAIQHKISILSLHTNFDVSENGTNNILADVLKLENTVILSTIPDKLRKLVTFVPHDYVDKVRIALSEAGAGVIGNYDVCSYNVQGYGTFRANEKAIPFVGEKGEIHKEPETRIEMIFPQHLETRIIEALLKVHPYEEVAYDIYKLENKHPQVGLGRVGYLANPMTTEAFLYYVKEQLKCNVLRYNNTTKQIIQKVAICSGAGISLINEAISANVDAFVTADLKYHDFASAPSSLLLVDAGHYETEIFFMKKMFDVISKKNTKFAINFSEKTKNPINYF